MTKLKITYSLAIKGKEVKLSHEEAHAIYRELDEVFGTKYTDTYIDPFGPSITYPGIGVKPSNCEWKA